MIRRFGVGLLAWLVGVACLFLIQYLVTKIWNLAGVTWGRNDLPIEALQQIATLSTSLIAVFSGSTIAALIAGRDALIVLVVMCLIGMAIDGYFMLMLGNELPILFRAAFVGAIPVGTLIAGLFVSRGLRRSLQQTDIDA